MTARHANFHCKNQNSHELVQNTSNYTKTSRIQPRNRSHSNHYLISRLNGITDCPRSIAHEFAGQQRHVNHPFIRRANTYDAFKSIL